MKTLIQSIVVGLLVCGLSFVTTAQEQRANGTVAAQPQPVSPGNEKRLAGYIFEKLDWIAAPNYLPAGAEMAVLEGSPDKAGPFTIRLKLPAGYRLPTQWTGENQSVTV